MKQRVRLHRPPGLSLLRVRLDDKTTFGPGKANLLEAIGESGSISAAARHLRMSYKRAWSLVEELNRTFDEPLVTSSRGGEKGGGAGLTETGALVLAHYRSLERAAEAALSADLDAMRGLLKAG